MLNFPNVFILTVCLPALTLAVSSINDIQTYKPCIVDSVECPDNQACFQYFCYPKEASAEEPLTSCKKNSECDGWSPNKTEKCFKEGQSGVCIPAEDYEMCEAHEDCEGRGEKCCNDYCCNNDYFQALLEVPCRQKDTDCMEIKKSLKSYEPTVAPPVVTTETTVPVPGSANYHYGFASVTFSIITTLMLNYQS